MQKAQKPHFLDSEAFALCIALFSFFVFGTHFLLDGKLYWDTAKIYPEFRDNLQALNQFGEIAWWFPHNQTGFPGYYHSVLGIPSLSNPAFILLGLFVWILGKFGLVIYNFQPLYVFYFAFLIPCIFLFSVRALAQKLWKSPTCTGFALILCAFSPGLTFHLSDIGYLEPTAYGLFFCSAWLDYLKLQSHKNWWGLVLASSLVTLSGTHASLYWNVYFLPTFVLCFYLIRRKLPLPSLTLETFLGIIFLLIPFTLNLVTFSQGQELVRSSIGFSQTYPFDRLAPGNPLEALIVSLPGFGFDWNSDRTFWKLMPLSDSYQSSYHFMGVLTFPLVALTLLKGSRIVRRSLFSIFALFFGVVVISGYSPFFSLLLRLPTPFRSCNHFSDAAFKAGGFLILVYGAVEGLRILQIQRKRNTILFFGLVFINLVLTLGVYAYLLGAKTTESLPFGLFIFFTFVLSILVSWMRTELRRNLKTTTYIFLSIVTLDVSSQSYLWVRNIVNSKVTLNSGWPAYSKIDETPADDRIGLKVGKDRHFYTNLLLMYPAYFKWQLNHWDPEQLPYLVAPRSKEVTLVKKTFNTVRLQVSSEENDTLFIRDAYSPYWKAYVDGREVPISIMKDNYKSIEITPGAHSILFQFNPSGIAELLFLSYSGIALAFFFCIKFSHAPTPIINQKHIMARSRDVIV